MFSAFNEKDNIILESVKSAEDGSGDLILRLYESKLRHLVNCSLGMEAYICDMLRMYRKVEVMVTAQS
ncbi:MAG: glycosyl hydrolase-related protein [Clostridia bacterium]